MKLTPTPRSAALVAVPGDASGSARGTDDRLATAARPPTAPRRARRGHSGLWRWLTTVDHKRIGILYGVTAFVFFLVGGLEALAHPASSWRGPNNTLSSAADATTSCSPCTARR